MKRKLCIPNLLMILLLLVYFLLTAYCIYLLLIASNLLADGTLLLTKEGPSLSTFAVAILGAILTLPQILLAVIFSKRRSLSVLFRFAIFYFAFMPAVDFGTLYHLFDGHPLGIIDFSLSRNLELLTKFPQDLVLLWVLLFLFLCHHKLKIKTWQIYICVISLFLGLGLLVLPELSEIMLFLVIYLISFLAFYWYEQLFHQATGSGKYFFYILLALLAGKGLYRMLAILYVYLYLALL